MKLKATIWFIYTPDEEQELIGHRWMLKCQSFTMVSNTIFRLRKNCIRSMRKIITKYDFKLVKSVSDYKTRSNIEFIM